MTEYTPDEEDFIDSWACAHVTPHDMTAEEAKDAARAFLARVRRDAAREALDRAEHRIARLEAQTDIRGRAVVMYRERAREAEARIKAVEDVLDRYAYTGIYTGQERVAVSDIRRALESVPPPRA